LTGKQISNNMLLVKEELRAVMVYSFGRNVRWYRWALQSQLQEIGGLKSMYPQ